MWESGFLGTLTAGSFATLAAIHKQLFAEIDDLAGQLRTVNLGPVSYTHLTLPTKLEV